MVLRFHSSIWLNNSTIPRFYGSMVLNFYGFTVLWFHGFIVLLFYFPTVLRLGPIQTSNFSCAKSNDNEQNPLFKLICIWLGTWKVRRLNWALHTLFRFKDKGNLLDSFSTLIYLFPFDNHIKLVSPAHNGQAEHSNRSCNANLKSYKTFRYQARHIHQFNSYFIKMQLLVLQISISFPIQISNWFSRR